MQDDLDSFLRVTRADLFFGLTFGMFPCGYRVPWAGKDDSMQTIVTTNFTGELHGPNLPFIARCLQCQAVVAQGRTLVDVRAIQHSCPNTLSQRAEYEVTWSADYGELTDPGDEPDPADRDAVSDLDPE
jgi:hypothetical protein